MKIAFTIGILALSQLLTADSLPPASRYPELAKRNIFDSTRQPARVPVRKVENIPPVAAPKPETIQLTGTLLRPGRPLAFFTGSQPGSSGVNTTGDLAGEFSIQEISANEVVLVDPEGEALRIKVGERLSRVGDTAWQKSETIASQPPPASIHSTTDKKASEEDVNEVMRRLMERRKQELNS